MQKISFVVAMEQEAASLIQRLDLKKIVPNPKYEKLQFVFYRGNYKDLDITITTPGRDPRYNVDSIGTEPAAVAAFATIMEFQPDLLINAGTAGSFAKHGASVGKVYLSDSAFYFHDHRIPIPGWEQFGKGAYPSLNVKNLAKKIGLETANVSSGNSLDYTERDLELMQQNGAILKEMEAGAIAWVAFVTKTPFFAIKSVTNLIDSNPDSPREFEKNFAIAAEQLTEKTLQVIDALCTTLK